MKNARPHVLAAVLVCLAAPAVHAFLPNPDLLTISPAIASAGSEVEVTIAGTHLDDAENLRFSHPGIVAKPVTTPADEYFPAPRPVTNRFTVEVGDDVPPGVYEVRSQGYFGLSTARPFLVTPAGRGLVVEEGAHDTRETAMPLPIETGVIGTLDAGKFDWYRFGAKKGERLLLHLEAEQLDSKADVLMAVFDSEGREVENSRLRYGRDPFVDFIAPRDSDYWIALSDSLYQGGRNYFYHLRVSRSPHIEFVFPPAGEPGTEPRLTFFGRNLPGGSPGLGIEIGGKPLDSLEEPVTIPEREQVIPDLHWSTPRRALLPAFEHRIGGSNPIRIGFATAPVIEELPESDEQRVPFPVEVAGRFEKAGDLDVFRFAGKKGESYWIEAVSERLGAATDCFVLVEQAVTDKAGAVTWKKVADNDDPPSFYGLDAFDDLNADTLDPALSFTASADADYRVTLINQRATGGPSHLYRLAIRDPNPGFQLIAVTERTKIINNDAYPAAPLVRRGGSMVYRILALRRDGFEGDITVTIEGLPDGITAQPLVLSGSSREGYLTVWADPGAAGWTGPVTIVGRARIGEGEIEQVARSASLIWGQRVFAYQAQVRSRLDAETVLSVVADETEPCRIAVAEDKVWTARMKETIEIPIRVTDTGTRKGNLTVSVHGFPGMHRNPPKATIAEGASDGSIKIAFTPSGNFAAAPGRYQFVLQGIGNALYRHNLGAAQRERVETDRLEKLTTEFEAATAEAKQRVTEVESALAAVKKRAAGAADDEARATLTEEAKRAEADFVEAKKELASHEARAKKAAALRDAAEKRAQAAEKLAAEKTNQFATFSQPVTVVVEPEKED